MCDYAYIDFFYQVETERMVEEPLFFLLLELFSLLCTSPLRIFTALLSLLCVLPLHTGHWIALVIMIATVFLRLNFLLEKLSPAVLRQLIILLKYVKLALMFVMMVGLP